MMNLELVQNQFSSLADIVEIGAGGFKTVYSAKHPDHGLIVIKIIRPGPDAEVIRRELIVPQQIPSGRMPEIIESGEFDDNGNQINWVFEQFIPGGNLADFISRNGPLSSTQLVRLTLHVLESLAGAEQVRIVHRDVKPLNILCHTDGSYWLIDFGIARHLDLYSMTSDSNIFGKCTLGYAPTEQMRNNKNEMDSRTDLFALGITVHEAASAVHPFLSHARDRLEAMHLVETKRLPRLALDIESADSFADLIETLVAKRRDQRTRTALEALEWVREIAESNNIS